ncbi:hypothetical protein ACTWP5_06055 [Streptomyces sp. 4N509B]|uniref:hypothetical protein n=1 Tax=Streptomyces sp. 4N509B TaxID=3457413 RepID=UPI003FD050F7
METIEALIPAALQPDVDALVEVDPEELARYVLETSHPWWRREPCAAALAGRVPEAFVPALLDLVRDDGDVTEVRVALLGVLAHRAELLPWLRDPGSTTRSSFGLAEAILRARGLAGDLTAARPLATLAHDEWRRWRLLGEEGLDALLAHHGAEALAAEVGEERPEDRAFLVRLRHRRGGDVTDALADPDVRVAHLAHERVDDPDRLRRFLDRAPTTEASLWAACALHRLTGDRSEVRAIHRALGRPRVEVDGLPEDVRSAIVHAYVPRCTTRTDPRWRVEAICTVAPPRPHTSWSFRASTVLVGRAFIPRPPVPCGELHGSGGGTYDVIAYRGGAISVSSLGPFVSGEDHPAGPRRYLEAAGFRWIEEPLASLTVTGLCVYFFGDREPLPVRDLLFYWQD